VSSWRATSDTFRGLSGDITRDLDGFGPPRLPGLASGTLPYGSFRVNLRIMWDVSHVNEPCDAHFCTKVTALPIEVIVANCLEGKTVSVGPLGHVPSKFYLRLELTLSIDIEHLTIRIENSFIARGYGKGGREKACLPLFVWLQCQLDYRANQ